jgi:hypothetical protein
VLSRDIYLAPHWVGVDLAHVSATVVRLYIGDVQLPGVMTVVSHREPRVVSHHVRLDSEDCLRVRLNPRHLHTEHVSTSVRPNTCTTKNKRKRYKEYSMCIIFIRKH